MIKQGTEANRYVADGDLDGWVGILRVCRRGSWVAGGGFAVGSFYINELEVAYVQLTNSIQRY